MSAISQYARKNNAKHPIALAYAAAKALAELHSLAWDCGHSPEHCSCPACGLLRGSGFLECVAEEKARQEGANHQQP